ncbi:SLC13 family permease, partial [Chloroflexota bacterium]
MRGTQWIGAGLGIAALVVFLLLPPFEPLTQLGMKTVGVFLFTVLWWVFIDTGFSSFLCIALFALTGVMGAPEAFAVSWGSWLVMFLIACFGLTEAIRLSGFSHRFAFWFLTRPFTKGHPWLLLSLFFLGVSIMGAFMSTTVTTILFMSLAVPMLEAMGYKKGDRFAAMLVMGIAWAAASSFVMTPIGHGSNLLCMDWLRRDSGYIISFLGWLVVGFPMGLLTYFLLMGAFRFIVRPDVSKFSAMADDYIRREAGSVGPLKLEEKIALCVFFGVVVCWVLPGVAGNILPEVSGYLDKMGFAIPPLIGVALLCIIRVKNQPLLSFRQWMTGVEWGAIALCAAIMAIGAVIGKSETGIPQFLTGLIQPVVTNAPFFFI